MIKLNRRAMMAGLASTGGLLLPGCSRNGPPTYGNILRMGDNFTYGAQRLLIPRMALAHEYDRGEISSIPAVGTTNPGNAGEAFYSKDFGETYDRLARNGFTDWTLDVSGSVERAAKFSLADIMALPRRTQITKHTCEEGWTAIAEWTGAPLHNLLHAVGMRPSARYVSFYAYDDVADSIDLVDALHPQTILAYGLNGGALPMGHGAPLRLRVERQVGYKSMKFLRRIVVTDEFDDLGMQGPLRNGWSWYVGI